MPRYIDADKLIWQVQDSDKYGTITKQVFISLLQNSETADVAPVIHGHWVDTYGHSLSECSACNCEFSDNIVLLNHYVMFPKYCPNCGAKMDEVV